MSFNPLDYPTCLMAPWRLSEGSSWQGHIPFAFVCMEMLKPRVVVQLAVEPEDAYLAFCQATEMLELPTECYALGAAMGNNVAAKGAKELAALHAYHDPLYGRFSTLVTSGPDQALADFADNSIDLLHISGRDDTAERGDFAAWRSKLSSRGVVLLHGIGGDRGAATRMLWDEIKEPNRHFELTHGGGLGILAMGPQVDERLLALLALSEREARKLSMLFCALGRAATRVDVPIVGGPRRWMQEACSSAIRPLRRARHRGR